MAEGQAAEGPDRTRPDFASVAQLLPNDLMDYEMLDVNFSIDEQGPIYITLRS